MAESAETRGASKDSCLRGARKPRVSETESLRALPEGRAVEGRAGLSFFDFRIFFGFGVEAMASRVERHLTEMAVAADVAESDFLVLRSKGLTTPAALVFRIPSSSDLEDLLEHEVMPRSAFDYGDERGIVTFARDPVEQWSSWMLLN